jgi:cold shock CspA family protein
MTKAAVLDKNEIKVGATAVPQWTTGKIKWFDRTRRFGFVYFDDSDEEAFLAWTAVQESNIRESSLMIGTRVRFTCTPPRRQGGRPEVVRLALIDRR